MRIDLDRDDIHSEPSRCLLTDDQLVERFGPKIQKPIGDVENQRGVPRRRRRIHL